MLDGQTLGTATIFYEKKWLFVKLDRRIWQNLIAQV